MQLIRRAGASETVDKLEQISARVSSIKGKIKESK